MTTLQTAVISFLALTFSPVFVMSSSYSSFSSSSVLPSVSGRQSSSGYGYSSEYSSPYGGDLYTAASGGGYGHDSYYKKCDCTKYDILGVVAGGAALAALGIYLLLQQAAAARALVDWTPQLPPLLTQALKLAMPQQDVAGKAVTTTCRLSRMLENGELTWSRAYGIGARSGYKDHEADCDCFRAIIGALAGFAALAAIAGFALQQAVAAAAARSLPSDGLFDGTFNMEGLHFISRYLKLMMDNEDPCVPLRLCRINEDAEDLSPQIYTGVKLAGLPISWFLSFSSTARHSFNDLCSAIGDVHSRGGCDALYPGCSWREKRLQMGSAIQRS
ncbi:uncharacterized protein LOC122388165 isoform X2 [Amphibalanus amphitrite]|uniref:uncharacterized protein LOC122388165 isoform X2 n=1 Tax=Amphibalanus amphitrite TaxID=1232801 RepID=UPI001C90C45B|nr:uncharacterized protein LOC122388165 isoform X2 [Amphibalanus amphitrite]